MTRTLTPPAPVSLAAFDAMFEAVKNWGRWGPDDERGTLNYLTPGQGRRRRRPGAERAHRLDGDPDQQGGRARQSQSRRPPHVAPARHARQPERAVVRHVLPRHGEPRRLPHPCRCAQPRRLQGQLYNGKPASLLTSRGSDWGSITAYANGIVGRGVLLDAARHRGVDWLEPGEAVTRARARGDRDGAGRPARRGRHPRLPHRPSRAPPGARRLEQRLSARRRGQGRAARRHRSLDARAAHRRLPARRRRRDGARAMSRACPIRSMRCS